MKTLFKVGFLVILIHLNLSSCRHVAYIESKAIIVSRTIDIALKDSAMIYGMVYYAADEKTPVPNANVWIETSNLKTTSDNAGFFSLKIAPGTYTIKCLGEYSSQEFTMVIKDLLLSPNEKVEIRFLHGERAE